MGRAPLLDRANERSAVVKGRCGSKPVATTRGSNAVPTSSQAAVAPATSVPFQENPVDTKVYHGTVTWSRGSMAWLSCDALSATYPGLDVFLHKNDCNVMPKQSDRVSFRLTLDHRGNPKGIQATVDTPAVPKPEPEMMSYVEYKQRQARRM